MMEVQQRLPCLSTTAPRIPHSASVANSSPLLKSFQTKPVTMVIESNHALTATPPTSPPQGETLPSENHQHQSLVDKDSGLLIKKFQADPPSSAAEPPHHPLWSQSSDHHNDVVVSNGVEEFSQAGMAREGLEEGSASPGQHSTGPLDEDRAREEALYNNHAHHTAPHTPGSGSEPVLPSRVMPEQESRRRRKPGLEDIVRRRRSELETNIYSPEDAASDNHASPEAFSEMENHQPQPQQQNQQQQQQQQQQPMVIEDEVDGGAPLAMNREDISREMMNAQAFAESHIKKSMQQAGFERIPSREEEEEEEEESLNQFSPPGSYLNRSPYLNHSRPDDSEIEEEIEDDDSGSGSGFQRFREDWRRMEEHSKRSLQDHFEMEAKRMRMDRMGEEGFREGNGPEDRKSEVTILPKTSSHHMPGGLPHRNHSSNLSESAYSPHHPHHPKMGWFPTMPPPMFPFGPGGLMDGPPGLGPKFMGFSEGKIMDVDKDYLKCNYCERTFRRQKNLENHIESTHAKGAEQRPKRENGDMYFKCTHCPYTTKHQSNLYVHLRIHTGERPYICGACGVQYSQSHSLKSHITNKHDGIMTYYIKEKRNRSPRGGGYMATQPGDHGAIFKMPPPPQLGPSMNNSNMEIVQRAIEMARNSMGGDGQGHPPPLMHGPPTSSAMHHPHSPLMSPNGHNGPHHPLFSKPGFPFNGPAFPGMPGMPFHDLPSNPLAPRQQAQLSPGSRGGLPNGGPGSAISPGQSLVKNEFLGLPTSSVGPTHGSLPVFPPASKPNVLSPIGGKLPMTASPNNNQPLTSTPTPNSSNNNPGKAPSGDDGDCGAMDLTTKSTDSVGRRASGDCASCVNCSHGNKLKMLRLNVVRMLTILVPNLNFEEKGISADSDSVDELLADVIESNTQDDMGH